MKRFNTICGACLILIAIWAAPSYAVPTLGCFLDAEASSEFLYPEALPEFFDLYVVLQDADYLVTGVEFLWRVDSPVIVMVDYTVPDGAIYLGDPLSGMSIAYWPPLNGFIDDDLVICTLRCISFEPCFCHGGSLYDVPLRVLPHPVTGELRGTYAWDNEFFSIVGLTTYACPYTWAPFITGVNTEAWDAIRVAFDVDIMDDSAENPSRYYVVEYSSPPETLAVVNAARYDGSSTVLTLERSMIDGMSYRVYADDICNASTWLCGDSRHDFEFDSSIGTMLQSFSASRSGTGIEVSWLMAEIDDDVDFRVLRADDEPRSFVALPSAIVEREGAEFRFTDRSIEPGRTYSYRIEYARDGERRVLFETEPIEIPALPLTLYQNVPNPFNPATTIKYYLPEPCRVKLDIFDISGKRIARLVDRADGPGYREITWNGSDEAGRAAASGIYLYRLTAGRETVAKKMVLLR